MNLNLQFIRAQLVFRMETEGYFPAFRGGMFRGTFGWGLSETSPALAADWFGLQSSDTPRPYRLRGTFGQQEVLAQKAQFEVGFDVFGPACDLWPDLVRGWRRAGEIGFGPDKARANLIGIRQEHLGGNLLLAEAGLPTVQSLIEWRPEAAPSYALQLNSPCHIKGLHRLPTGGEFFVSIRRRWQQLSPIAKEANPEELLRWKADWFNQRNVEFSRHSTRSGDRDMSGWMGQARLTGPHHPELLHHLAAGQVLGLGKWTAFGAGEVQIVSVNLGRP